jgi:hypothetical protein
VAARKRRINIIVACVLLACAVFEVFHDVEGWSWKGMTPFANLTDVVNVPVWMMAGIGLLFKASWGWIAAVLSAALMVAHGVGIDVGGSKQGMPFAIVGLIVLGFILYGKPWSETKKH